MIQRASWEGETVNNGGSSPDFLFCKIWCRFPRSFLHTYIYCSKKSVIVSRKGRQHYISINMLDVDNSFLSILWTTIFNCRGQCPIGIEIIKISVIELLPIKIFGT